MAAWLVFAGCVAAFVCAGRMSRSGAESARFKRLRRLWDIVPVGRQGRGAARVARPCARVIRRTAQALNVLLNGSGSALLREGQTEGGGVVKTVRVSSKKMGLEIQLGVLWHIGTHPHTDKMTAENGDFEAINTPLIPKLTPLKLLLKFV